MAFLLLEPECPLSFIASNDSEVPEVLDSDRTTCITLSETVGSWLQISVPYIAIKGKFYVTLVGNHLRCSPVFGLSVSIISGCDIGTCGYSQCISSDLATSDGMGGCKYRCHSYSVCSHITVDIAGLSATTLNRTLCEIIF